MGKPGISLDRNRPSGNWSRPVSDNYYRAIGKEGYEDFVKSMEFRGNPAKGIEGNPAYWSKGSPLERYTNATRRGSEYLVEAAPSAKFAETSNGYPITRNGGHIAAEDGIRIYKNVGGAFEPVLDTMGKVGKVAEKAIGLPVVAAMAGIEGAVTGLNTPTSEYARRMGVDAPDTVLGETAVRTVGVLSDVGNAALMGIPRMIEDAKSPKEPVDADAEFAQGWNEAGD